MTGQFLRRHDPSPQAAFEDPLTARSVMHVTLYTDSYVVRGTLNTRQRRLTDALTVPNEPFLVVEDALFEEFGSRALVERAPFAQINLSTVLFAFAAEGVAATPELRTVKVAERALISLPPFRIVGHLHLLPERGLREALEELVGRFVPLTDSAFWSDRLGEPRTPVPMLAFNHARAQILAPYEERDVWEGTSGTPQVAREAAVGGAPDPWTGSPDADAPDRGANSPWAGTTGGGASDGGTSDPWADETGRTPTPPDDPWTDEHGRGPVQANDPWRDDPGRKPAG